MSMNIEEKPDLSVEKECLDTLELIAKSVSADALKFYNDFLQFKKENDLSLDKVSLYKFPTFEFPKTETESNVCAKVLSKGTKSFKCHDCMYESNSIQCVSCFEASDHKGHIYELINVVGGCCDCGDEEKWNPKGSCTKHTDNGQIEKYKAQLDKGETEVFVKNINFCFYYLFSLYDDAIQEHKVYKSSKSEENKKKTEKKIKLMKEFGFSLIEFLDEFNKNSLISNLMTFEVLRQPLGDSYPSLSFNPNITKVPILEALFNLHTPSEFDLLGERIVNLYMRLFPIREFKRILTTTFMRMHNESPCFAKSIFNHISCQLLTNHQMIKELVESKEIKPFLFRPNETTIINFESIAQDFYRYFLDLNFLSMLYQDSAIVYIDYHISEGCLPLIGEYREYANEFDNSINYYGIEEIYFNKLFKILKPIKESKNCIEILEKGIKSMWIYIVKHYNGFQAEPNHLKNQNDLYLTQERTFASLIFLYFEILNNNDSSELEKNEEVKQKKQEEEKNINRLIELIGLHKQENILKILEKMFLVLNNSFEFFGLTINHPETTERFYSYYSFVFRKSLIIPCLDMYLYKILSKIWLNLKKQQTEKLGNLQEEDLSKFERTLKNVESMFDEEFNEDNDSVFDRKKKMIGLYSFLSMILEISETDTYETIIAMALKLKGKKYEDKVFYLYEQLLYPHKKMSLKNFKAKTDEFFVCEDIFEKFIESSKNVEILDGKISIKEKETEEGKYKGEINFIYSISLKDKLRNLNSMNLGLNSPRSNNHFLGELISETYVERAIKIALAYRDIILIKGSGLQNDAGVLGHFIVRLIAIAKSLENSEASRNILKYIKLFSTDKKTLDIFSPETVNIIIGATEASEVSVNLEKNMKEEAEEKKLERKKKLEQKKKEKLAKFKKNEEKSFEKYQAEMNEIKEEMKHEKEIEEQNLESQSCIICRESYEKEADKNSDMMLMGFMQFTSMYHTYFREKKIKDTNSVLTFKTCGHYIHKNCSNKIHGNKEFFLCQLCKSSVNCLFPVCVSYLNPSNNNNLIQTKQEEEQFIENIISENYSRLYVISVVLVENCLNGFDKVIEDKRDIQEKLIESVIANIIMSGLLQKNFFIKKQLPIFRNILFSLRNSVMMECKKNKNLSESSESSESEESSEEESLEKEKEKRKKEINEEIEESLNENQNEKVEENINNECNKKDKKESKKRGKKIKDYKIFDELYECGEEEKLEKKENLNNKEKKDIEEKDNNNNECHQQHDDDLIKKIEILLKSEILAFMYNDEIKNTSCFGVSKDIVNYIKELFKELTLCESTTTTIQAEKSVDVELENEEKSLNVYESLPVSHQITEPIELKSLSEKLKFAEPPKSMELLFEERGKCPNCNTYTSLIVICMMCEWRGCQGCKKENITQHNFNKHSGNSIYIMTDTGNSLYISRKKCWIFESIYENYLEEPFKGYEPGTKLDKYVLNRKKLEKLIEVIKMFEIESTIRYQEFRTKKSSMLPLNY